MFAHMDISHPQNTKVLAYLARGKRDVPVVSRPDSVPQPYYQCGCHPDIVERLWDQIGAALPADCRCLVHGTPTLVHPQTCVILAIGIGTQYGLRCPGGLATAAIKAGAKTSTTWSGGGEMETRRDLGEDWVFGAWLPEELNWCRSVYEGFNPAS